MNAPTPPNQPVKFATKHARSVVVVVLFIAAVLGIVLIATIKKQDFNWNAGFVVGDVGIPLLGIVLSYLIWCFSTVKANEVAAMFIFNDPVGNIGPGLHFSPFGISSIWKERGTIIQDELPAIMVKFGQPNPADTDLIDDPYNIAVVMEVTPVVCWRINSAQIG